MVRLGQTMVRLSLSYLGTPSRAARAGCAALGKVYRGVYRPDSSTQSTHALLLQRLSLAAVTALAKNVVATQTDEHDPASAVERGADFAAADSAFRDSLLAVTLDEADDDLGPAFRRQLADGFPSGTCGLSEEHRRAALARPRAMNTGLTPRTPSSRRVVSLRQSRRSLLYHAVVWRVLAPLLDAGTRGSVQRWTAPADRWLSRLLALVYPQQTPDELSYIVDHTVLPCVLMRCAASLRALGPVSSPVGEAVLQYNLCRLAAGLVGKVVRIGQLIGNVFDRSPITFSGDDELFALLRRGEEALRVDATWDTLAAENGFDVRDELYAAPQALNWPSRLEFPLDHPPAAHVLPVGPRRPWNAAAVTSALRGSTGGAPITAARRHVNVVGAAPQRSASAEVRGVLGRAPAGPSGTANVHRIPADFVSQLASDEAAARAAQAAVSGTDAGEPFNQPDSPEPQRGAVTGTAGTAPRPHGASAGEQFERSRSDEAATELAIDRSILNNAPRGGPARSHASIQQPDQVGTCSVVAGTRRSAKENATDGSGG